MSVLDKFIKTRADRKAIDEGCYFDEAAGERVVSFLQKYVTLSTTGKLLELYPFQRDAVLQLFSWKKPSGQRRFTRCLLTTGKKSFGKTVLSAALSLYLLMADGVQSPLVVLGAVNREQSAEMFKEVRFMAEAHPFLRDRVTMTASTYRAKYKKANGELRAISCDSPSKGGWNCSAVILDEVCHYPRPTATDPGLWEMLKGSMKSRENPLMICASNAGFDKGHHYYRDVYQPAKLVATNQSDDTSILPVIYEVPEEANWKDRSKLYLANPGLACGLLEQSAFDDEYNDALRNKAGERWWRRYVCNSWTPTDETWVDADEWQACESLTYPELHGAPVYVGVDLAHTLDLVSVAAVYPIGDKYYVKSYNFVPRDAAENREKQNLRDYTEMSEQGHLKIIDGNCCDFGLVRQCIQSIPGDVRMVVFDRWNSLESSQLLEKEGFDVFNFHQTASYFNEPCKKLEQLVKDRKIVHDGNSCLRWCLNSVQLKVDDRGLCKPVKGSAVMKIDAAVSLLMALSQAMLHAGREALPSGYEANGVTFC